MLQHPKGRWVILLLFLISSGPDTNAQQLAPGASIVSVGSGFGALHVNASSYARQAITTASNIQYVAFYNEDTNVVIAKRIVGSTNWQFLTTTFKPNRKGTDDHEVISLAVDGGGYLHCAWGMHNSALNYARSSLPGSFTLIKTNMTKTETGVTYPQFINLPSGDLLFFFRSGSSGAGDVLLNRWTTTNRTWTRVGKIIDGIVADNNAYLNFSPLDSKTNLHLSWCWRDTPSFDSNHDLLYASSPDLGITWKTSGGSNFFLPMSLTNAEIVCSIDTNNYLVNSTGMTVDRYDRPLIATWWAPADDGMTQIMAVWKDATQWRTNQVTHRGGGWWMNRPIVVTDRRNRTFIVYSEDSYGYAPTVAYTASASRRKWDIAVLSSESLGSWEPLYDEQLWKRDGKLHLLYQPIGTGANPSPVSVLEFNPEEFLPVRDWNSSVTNGVWDVVGSWTNNQSVPSNSLTPLALSFTGTNALHSSNNVSNGVPVYYLALGGDHNGTNLFDGELLVFTNSRALSPSIVKSGTAAACLATPIRLASDAGFEFDRPGTLVFSNVVSGPGQFQLFGVGSVLLLASNSFSGGLVVDGGTVSAVEGGLGSGKVEVGGQGGGALFASGVVAGSIEVKTNGLLGLWTTNVGTLSISNQLTSQGTLWLRISSTSNDMITANDLTFGGTLVVTNLGATFHLGDTFQLFQANGYHGSFSTLSLPSLSPNLSWDFTGLTNGMLRVAPMRIASSEVSQGLFKLTAAGSPGQHYALQAATALVTPIPWLTVKVANADTAGRVDFDETLGATKMFYRVIAE
jgi:hypothetical protein